ncbi:murein hydrolase activator EnvC family protein [Streptomyces mutabilis]|uniref:Peptidase M23 n=1 Tax=Streptomyces mutabilis TaxID=67332 RepID=A0A086MX26_9ACTN|nr:M23 family metallopeptidase [Streptomyces mutabilis]KFG73444.1 peptidase M23 [Streptomyces mutabilis]
MRTRRWVSAGVWVALLLVVAPGPPPPASTAVGPAAAAVATSGADRLPEPGGTEPGVPAVARGWPVGNRPAVLRGWEPPANPYGPGHRGVDLAAQAGATVRAVAAGTVSFAGRVAGRGVVSVELAATGDPPLRTTYEPVAVSVKKGDEVAAGEVLGTVEPTGSHCTGCLHWGLLRGDVYVNPLSVLPPWLLSGGPSVLLPVLGVPEPAPRT